MGYYVKTLESTFKIPSENLDAAYETMCQLNFTVPNSHKRGGSWGGGKISKDNAPEYGPYEAAWFSWMDWNYHEICPDAKAILDSLGFETDYDNNGNLEITHYDNKTGQEDLFLNSISHLAKGCIVWEGEDGEQWGETYGGRTVVRKVRMDHSDIVTY